MEEEEEGGHLAVVWRRATGPSRRERCVEEEEKGETARDERWELGGGVREWTAGRGVAMRGGDEQQDPGGGSEQEVAVWEGGGGAGTAQIMQVSQRSGTNYASVGSGKAQRSGTEEEGGRAAAVRQVSGRRAKGGGGNGSARRRRGRRAAAGRRAAGRRATGGGCGGGA